MSNSRAGGSGTRTPGAAPAWAILGGGAPPRGAFPEKWSGPSCKVGRARKERNGSKKTRDVPRRSPPQGRPAKGQAGSQAGAEGRAPRERGERARDRGGRGGWAGLEGIRLVLSQQGTHADHDHRGGAQHRRGGRLR